MSGSAGEMLNPFTEQTAGPYFVGREEQLDQFNRALIALKAGRPGHMFVAGVHGTGKTSYLAKLVELARNEGIVAVMPTLDPAASARQHILSVVQAVVEGVEQAQLSASGTRSTLLRDWRSGPDSTHFLLPRADRLQGDDLKADLSFLQQVGGDVGMAKTLICIDEGQRIEPFALSALKNALQHLDGYLLVLSLRLVDDRPSAVEAGRRILDERAAAAEGDFGAARFFVTGIPLGPFATDDEARECMTKRLERNAIRFPDEVATAIARITSRLPAEIIALASEVYDACADAGSATATRQVLCEAFGRRYKRESVEAIDLCEALSHSETATVRALLRFERAVTAVEVAEVMYPSITGAASSGLARAVEQELEHVASVGFVTKRDAQYEISEPARRFALELALERE